MYLRFQQLTSFLLLIAIFPASTGLAQDPSSWKTHYEKSNFLETGDLQETETYLRKLRQNSAGVRIESLGKTPLGHNIPVIIVDAEQQFTPIPPATRRKPVVLILSGIHAGEIAGKDASLLFLRDLLINDKYPGILKKTTIIFIPIFNVDGHENRSAFNRPNQVGPKETGYRATAQGYNLNRDFLKAEAPEMQAWLRFFNNWEPDFLVDNHTTDGADFQYPLTYGIETQQLIADPLRTWTAQTLEPRLNAMMAADNFPVFPYFRLKQRPDIRKGVVAYPLSPRFSTGYGTVRNRIFFLAETHALKPYQVRVNANYALIKNLLTIVSEQAAELIRHNIAANHLTSRKLVGTVMPLSVKVDMSDSSWVNFAGKESRIVHSKLTNAPWVQYSDQPAVFQVPHFSKTLVVDSAVIPFAYLIPPQWQQQIALLEKHGIHIRRLSKETELEIETYRFQDVKWQNRSFEGHLMATFQQLPVTHKVKFPKNTAVVFMQQANARVAAHLLEPQGPDSFVRWGLWNTIFERKEYAEDYYLENLGRKMIEDNPQLEAIYLQKIKDQPENYPNHWAKLYYFYAQSPYWENHVNLYPVGKLMQMQQLSLASDN